MELMAAERETVIQWSDADKKIAHVYTCQRRVRRKLWKLTKKYPNVRLMSLHKDDQGKVTGVEYDVALEHVRGIFPGKKRNMSEANREAAKQRMTAMRRARLRIAG